MDYEKNLSNNNKKLLTKETYGGILPVTMILLEGGITMEQRTLARWLKAVLIGVGLCGLVVYGAILPLYGQAILGRNPDMGNRYWPWLGFLWASGVPCYAALVIGWRIAANIGRDRSFSEANARLLKVVALLAAGDAAFFFAGNLVLLFANMSHPGVVIASLLVVFAGVAVSVAAAALSHLVLKASLLQEQSDLTI